MKMDWLRTALIAGIGVICFLLMIRWTEFQEQRVEAQNQSSPSTGAQMAVNPVPSNSTTPQTLNIEPGAQAPVNDLPTTNAAVTNSDALPQATTATTSPVFTPTTNTSVINIETDVLKITVDPNGGDIVSVHLPTFYAKLNTPDSPLELLKRTENQIYIAKSGLIGANATDKSDSVRPTYSVAGTQFKLQEGEDQLVVDLTFAQSSDVNIIKRFTLQRGSHLVDIAYIIQNNSASAWQAQIYGQIRRNTFNPVASTGLGMQPYLGAATTTTDKNYKKVSFGDMEDEPFTTTKQGGWVAMIQHYFLSAWVPAAEDTNKFELKKSQNSDLYYLNFVSPSFTVAPNNSGEKHFGFYAGPKDIKTLETISPYLDLTVDYGILWWIAKPLFFLLDFIHGFVGNWGIAIILLTVLIKIMFFYPSAASYRSMAKMRKVQPKMAELKERYGDNKQKFSSEMMKLYRDEKVNPLGGCLPILIQMPVFLALYWALMESVELRHAPFFLWIHDLSVKDPYFVLPLIMGATMFIQQKLNPTPPDPMQAKVMQMMPIFFTFLFLVFPAGLVLYWVVNNTLSIIQQYVITKQIEKAG